MIRDLTAPSAHTSPLHPTTSSRQASRALRRRLRLRRGPALRASITAAAIVATSLFVAACGSDEATAERGGLSFVPADAVGVALVSVQEDDLQRSLTTLKRLPAWALAEPALPASDAEGLLTELVRQMAADAGTASEAADITYAADVKPWIGDRGGIAVLGDAVSDPAALDGDTPPVVAWLDAKDDERASEFARKVAGDAKKTEHDGVTIYEHKDGSAVFVHDGALVMVPASSNARKLLDARNDGGDTFADGAHVADLLDGGDREEQLVSVISVDRAVELAAAGARQEKDPQAAKVQQLVDDEELRDMLPDVVSVSTGIDEVGLWFDTSWAPAAKPAISDARELAERMPAGSMSVQAQATSSSLTESLPTAWQKVRDTWQVDLAAFSAQCPPARRESCTLALGLVGEVLEGDLLKRMDDAAGPDGAIAMAQTLRPGSAANPFATDTAAIMRADDPAAMNEVTGEMITALAPLLKGEGLDVTWKQDGADATITAKARKGSSLARELQRDPVAAASLADLGTPAGMRLNIRSIDEHTQVLALPEAAEADLLAAWSGDASRITDDRVYERDLDVVKVPAETSLFSWTNLGETFLQGAQSAGLQDGSYEMRMLQSNLDQLGGLIMWSERRGDDDAIGVLRMVLPVHEEALQRSGGGSAPA